MTEFDDLTNRILDKLDVLHEKVENLDKRILLNEERLATHFKEIDDKQVNKDRKFYVIIAGIGILFTSIEVLQSIL